LSQSATIVLIALVIRLPPSHVFGVTALTLLLLKECLDAHDVTSRQIVAIVWGGWLIDALLEILSLAKQIDTIR
jgi:hypothetical protein